MSGDAVDRACAAVLALRTALDADAERSAARLVALGGAESRADARALVAAGSPRGLRLGFTSRVL